MCLPLGPLLWGRPPPGAALGAGVCSKDREQGVHNLDPWAPWERSASLVTGPRGWGAKGG